MTFNLAYFITAWVLLWLPLPLSLSHSQSAKYQWEMSVATLSGVLRAWQNWVDLLRSAAGAFILMNHSILIEPGAEGAAMPALLIKAGILIVGVLIQTLSFDAGTNFFAPLFYLTGLAAVIPDYWAGGFAVLFGWVLAAGSRQPRFLLPAMGVALGIAGLSLEPGDLWLWLTCGLIATPIGLAALSGKRVLYVSCENKLGRKHPVVTPKPAADTDTPAAAAPPGTASKNVNNKTAPRQGTPQPQRPSVAERVRR